MADFQDLQCLLEEIPARWGIPGLDCVIWQDHRQIFRYKAGFSDPARRIPVREDALYNIYSSTKIITCAAALQLAERGLILLDDPVSLYLPEFRDMSVKNGTFAVTQAKNPVRILDLFTMSAGLSYELDTPPMRALKERTGGDFDTRDFVRALAEGPLLFEPGTRWHYSYCHDVLGALIEAVSGMSFGQYLKKNIFDPLGMHDTGFSAPEEKRSRIAPQFEYDASSGSARPIENRCIGAAGTRHESGGGGLITSVDDYIKFADAMACGGVSESGARILASNTIDVMRLNQLDDRRLADFHANGYHEGLGYGLGVGVVLDRARNAAFTSGDSFFWGGIGGVQALIDPGRRLSLFMGAHCIGCPSALYKQRMWNILYSVV